MGNYRRGAETGAILARMSSAKQDVAAMLNQLPDDVTIEDIQYHLYVLEKIRRGLEDKEHGRVVTHEEVKANFKKWLDERSGRRRPRPTSEKSSIT